MDGPMPVLAHDELVMAPQVFASATDEDIMRSVSSNAFKLISTSEPQTEAIGRAIGQAARPGDVVALVGDLGAGKTCLTRGIAEGMGIHEPVTSPTFILVAEYRTARGFPLYHADCYRFEKATVEAAAIGLDELMEGTGLCVIEWADRIESLLPPDHLTVTLTPGSPDERHIDFSPTGPNARALLWATWENLAGELSMVNWELGIVNGSEADVRQPSPGSHSQFPTPNS